MAIFSLNASFICRSKGQSSTAFAAYMNGQKIQDERTGKTYDFSRKTEVISLGILAPKDAPEWMKESATLWNGVEAFEDELAAARFRGDPKDPEKHKKSMEARDAFLNTAQISQKMMIAIPKEFTKEQAADASTAFLNRYFVSRGLLVDSALHWEEGNPHLHAMIPRRAVEEGSFSKRKDREVVSKEYLLEIRKGCADLFNEKLKEIGSRERVTEKSFKDLGLELLGTSNETRFPNVNARMMEENAAIRSENMNILIEKPEELVKLVATQKTVFTAEDLKRAVMKRAGGDPVLVSALEARVSGVKIPEELRLSPSNDNTPTYEGMTEQNRAVYAHNLKVTVESYVDSVLKDEGLVRSAGENINREKVYASETYYRREAKIISAADRIQEGSLKSLDLGVVLPAIARVETENGFEFSAEQKEAVEYVCSGSDFRCLVGRAGTGKTTIMKAVAEAYKAEGFNVKGAAFQGRVADVMGDEIGIEAKTFDSYFYAWDKHDKTLDRLKSGNFERGKSARYYEAALRGQKEHLLTDRDVLIIDEANMVGASKWERFLEHASAQGVRVIALGDSSQKLSLEEGDTFRLLTDRFGAGELHTIRRQRLEWQSEASSKFNDHTIEDGLKAYAEHDCIQWSDTQEAAVRTLCNDYIKDLEKDGTKSQVALAYTNREVFDVNELIFKAHVDKGLLQSPFSIKGSRFALGARVVFLENDNHGSRVGLLEQETPEGAPVHKKGVRNGTLGTLIGWDQEASSVKVRLDDKRVVHFNPEVYAKFQLGYAMTIMKSEGSTFDRSYVLPSSFAKTNDALVMMTRHRESCQVYAPRETFTDMKGLVKSLSRSGYKAVLQDFVINDENRDHASRVQRYMDIGDSLNGLQNNADGLDTQEQKEIFRENLTTLYESHKECAEDILENWGDTAVFARQIGLSKEFLEVKAGLREKLLSDQEERVKGIVGNYGDVARQARDVWSKISETHSSVLAINHPLYGDYLKLKEERGSLAVSVFESKALSRPFFVMKETEDDGKLVDVWGEIHDTTSRVGFKSAAGHAETFLKEKQDERWLQKLTPEEQRDVHFLKDYKASRNTASALYHDLRAHKKSSVVLWTQIHSLSEDLKRESVRRDDIALRIISRAEHYEGFFERIGLKEKNLDTLLVHALYGEFREQVEAYRQEPDALSKGIRAQDIMSYLNPGDQQKNLLGILREAGLDQPRLKFDMGVAEKIESGELSFRLLASEAYVSLDQYRKAKKESSATWNVVQGTFKSELKTLQQDQIGLLQQIDSDMSSYEALAQEWEDKISSKTANDCVGVYVSERLIKTVASLNPTVIHHENYHSIVNNQDRIISLQHKLSHKDPFELLRESGKQDEWKAEKGLREKLALEASRVKPLLEIVKKTNPSLSTALEKDARVGLIDERIETFLKTNSLYAKSMAASWLAEETCSEQKSGTRHVIRALRNRGVSFETLHCYGAIWKGLEEDKLSPSEIAPLEAGIWSFAYNKGAYSQAWEEMHVNDRDVFEAKIEEHRAQIQDVFKGKIKEAQIEKSEDTSRVTVLSIAKGALKVGISLERKYEQENKSYNQKVNALAGKNPGAETVLTAQFEKAVDDFLNTQVESFGLGKDVVPLLKRDLESIQGVKDELFGEKIKSYESVKDQVQKYKEDRNASAYNLMQVGVIKDYVKASDTYQVKRIGEFAEEHEAYLRLKEAELQGIPNGSIPKYVPKKGFYKTDVEALHSYLVDNIETLAVELFGPPTNHSTKDTLKFGSKKGSLHIELFAEKRGWWVDRAEGEGGKSPFSLIRFATGIKDKKETISWAEDWAGGSFKSYVPRKKTGPSESALDAQLKEKGVRETKIKGAESLYQSSIELPGTTSDVYLRKVRGIKGELSDSLRHIPKGTRFPYMDKDGKEFQAKVRNHSLGMFAKDDEGKLKSVQLVALDSLGNRQKHSNGEKVDKYKYGVGNGAFVTVQTPSDKQGNNKAIYIAEGVETALSIKEAGVQGKIVASLGIYNIDKYKGPETEVILCADNDDHNPKSKTHEVIEKAKAHFEGLGKQVKVIKPETPGQDFNDVLKEKGTQAIKDLLNMAKIERTDEPTSKIDYNETHDRSETANPNQPQTPGPQSEHSKIGETTTEETGASEESSRVSKVDCKVELSDKELHQIERFKERHGREPTKEEMSRGKGYRR